MTDRTILVTGTTGQLGDLVVRALLARGVAPERIVATARDTDRLAGPGGLAESGVVVRRLDYTDPASITAALDGVDRVLLVSSSVVGQRTAQHRAVVDAATAAGVDLLAYTSIANAETTKMVLAREHRETERLIEESGLPHTFLRNGWYLENHTGQLAVQLEHGAILGATGNATFNPAARSDFADAAAAVLLLDSPAEAYELGGAPLTLDELAAVVTDVTGTKVAHADVPVEQLEQVLLGAGLPAELAAILAEADAGLGRGELQVDPSVLEGLIGRPATSARAPDAPRRSGYGGAGAGNRGGVTTDEQHTRPAGVDDATVEALGKISEALEAVEVARGGLYTFHRLSGTADLTLGEGVDALREAGHTEMADRIERDLVGRNVLYGRWTFQIVEEYDDGYYADFKRLEREAREAIVEGKRHLYEAEMKEDRRTHGRPDHERDPGSPPQS